MLWKKWLVMRTPWGGWGQRGPMPKTSSVCGILITASPWV